VLAGALAAAVAVLSAAAAPSSRAFGKGFPGYDLNVEAQARASAVTKAAKDEQRAKAAAYKAAKAAAAAAAPQ
jgi:hypothetical protein